MTDTPPPSRRPVLPWLLAAAVGVAVLGGVA